MLQHIMIDIETTGLNPCKNIITSIASVGFTIEDREAYQEDVGNVVRIRAIGSRSDNPKTLVFRKKHQVDLKEQIYPEIMIQDFFKILFDRIDKNTYVWSKPVHFDIAFLESYYNEFNVDIPWHYRNVRDLNTFIWAHGGDPKEVFERVIKITHYSAHDPYYDALLQINMIDYTLHHYK